MTTPERIRTRQRKEMAMIAALFILMGVVAFVLDRRDDVYRTCLLDYIEVDSETGQIRSGLVADESQATRDIIRRVFAAETRAESFAAYNDYRESLEQIDKLRDENPVRTFNPEVCQ